MPVTIIVAKSMARTAVSKVVIVESMLDRPMAIEIGKMIGLHL